MDNITQTNEFVTIIRAYTSDVSFWSKPVSVVITFVVVSTSCALSDLYQRRKPFMMMAVVGELLSELCLFICYWYEGCSLQILVATEVVSVLFGGQQLFWTMSWIFVIQNTHPENRTPRLLLLQASKNIIYTFCLWFSIDVDFTYLQVHTMILTFFFLTVLYFVYVVKDERPEQELRWDTSVFKQILICSVIADGISHLKKISAKKLFILVAGYLIFFAKNSWSDGEYSNVLATYIYGILAWPYEKVAHLIYCQHGSAAIIMIIVSFISKKFQLDGYTILIFVYLNKVFGNVVIASVSNRVIIFIVSAISSVTTFYMETVLYVAIVSKMVSSGNIGKLQLLFRMNDMLEPLSLAISSFIFDELLSDKHAPNTFLYIGAFIYLVCLVVAT
ncbi:uncharacterized protein LOC135124236 isoform X2 [Zophobas morio]